MDLSLQSWQMPLCVSDILPTPAVNLVTQCRNHQEPRLMCSAWKKEMTCSQFFHPCYASVLFGRRLGCVLCTVNGFTVCTAVCQSTRKDNFLPLPTMLHPYTGSNQILKSPAVTTFCCYCSGVEGKTISPVILPED